MSFELFRNSALIVLIIFSSTQGFTQAAGAFAFFQTAGNSADPKPTPAFAANPQTQADIEPLLNSHLRFSNFPHLKFDRASDAQRIAALLSLTVKHGLPADLRNYLEKPAYKRLWNQIEIDVHENHGDTVVRDMLLIDGNERALSALATELRTTYDKDVYLKNLRILDLYVQRGLVLDPSSQERKEKVQAILENMKLLEGAPQKTETTRRSSAAP